MKINKYLFLIIVLCFALTACDNTKTQNISMNLNKTANVSGNSNLENLPNAENQVYNSNENQTVNATNQKTSNANRTDENSDDNDDFTGTAGITDKRPTIGGAVVLREVRAAQHGNFDRVVFEFSGAEMPGYHIEYVDKPVRTCGSGNVVPLKGDSWLEIRIQPAQAHDDDGNSTLNALEQNPNLPIIKQLKSTCDFEAEVEWVLGVASPNKYRVLELKNPVRLVVDVKH